LLVAVTVFVGWSGLRLWNSWRDVERVEFDTANSRTALEGGQGVATTTTNVLGPVEGNVDAGPPPTAETTVSLIIGTDQLSSDAQSRRADVIMLFIVPAGGLEPILVSLPRDLYIANPCTGELSRVNANLNGCGDLANGPEQLAIAVEDFTGLRVDHFLMLDFDGFRALVDRVGGMVLCVEHRVRDTKSGLSLPTGCTKADGAQALAWIRSRRTEEYVDGAWRSMGVSDLTRNQRQQDVLMHGLRLISRFRDASELVAAVEDLSGVFVIDDGLSLTEAVALAWDFRSIDLRHIVRPVIPTEYFTTEGGAVVLLPTETFEATIRAVYPNADTLFGGAAT
jgi:LCP family protein required for cell wall assembly